MYSVRDILKLVLMACFVAALAVIIERMMLKETSISLEHTKDSSTPLPALTLCPSIFQPEHLPNFTSGQNQTLVEFYQQIEPLERDIAYAELRLINNPFNAYEEHEDTIRQVSFCLFV